ncbi:MAG: DUF465 domain-containing protein [Gammaproteobacteria bacterium]|nr:DUF465 domain-containing protein [Gammaproteobacteria bacterium]
MSQQRNETTQRRLEELRLEHRELDARIERMLEGVSVDELQVKRMKKRKLQLRDVITRLESSLIPDIDA